MTKKELYTCDICHTDYAKKEDAINCEKEHFKAYSVKDIRIRAHEKYPDKVLLKFSDGVEVWYKR